MKKQKVARGRIVDLRVLLDRARQDRQNDTAKIFVIKTGARLKEP